MRELTGSRCLNVAGLFGSRARRGERAGAAAGVVGGRFAAAMRTVNSRTAHSTQFFVSTCGTETAQTTTPTNICFQFQNA